MNIFSDIETFFSRTIPGAIHDVYTDITGMARDIVRSPVDIAKTVSSTIIPVVNKTADVIQTTVKTTGESIASVGSNVSNIFNSPILIIVGIGAAIILGPKLIKMIQ